MVFLGDLYPCFGASGHPEVARMLIERGADVSSQDKDGQTPLHIVFLVNWNPYIGTSSQPEVARMLIERGADVSVQDKDGRTPMHLASQAGLLEVIPMHLVHGADPSAQK
jgi:ankyrin repeat protein